MRSLLLATTALLTLATPALAQDAPERAPCAGYSTAGEGMFANYGAFCHLDPETGCEYVIVTRNNSIAIAPRLSGAGRQICASGGRDEVP